MIIKGLVYRIKNFFVRRKLYSLIGQYCDSFETFESTGYPIVNVSEGSTITIGKNFRINNELSGNRIGFTTPCVFRAEGANINIGDNVGMSQTVVVAKNQGNISIGNNVLFGGGVKLYSSDFHSLNYLHRRDRNLDEKFRLSAPINIGADCFLGADVIVLKGVTIGERTVVGAGSVVSRDLPSDCVAVGNPAKIVKSFVK